MSRRALSIACFPEAVERFDREHVVVGIDVIRATTSAITALAQGRRCFPVPSVELAREVGSTLTDPLYAGELGGEVPEGFEIQNSPTLIAQRTDVERPMVLLSTAGTDLLWRARDHHETYAACLRNISAQVEALADHGGPIAVIGAGGRGTFRVEDKIGCARVAVGLLDAGFAADEETRSFVERWAEADLSEIEDGPSADYLRRSDQTYDLDFVLEHVDDLRVVGRLDGGELKAVEL